MSKKQIKDKAKLVYVVHFLLDDAYTPPLDVIKAVYEDPEEALKVSQEANKKGFPAQVTTSVLWKKE